MKRKQAKKRCMFSRASEKGLYWLPMKGWVCV